MYLWSGASAGESAGREEQLQEPGETRPGWEEYDMGWGNRLSSGPGVLLAPFLQRLVLLGDCPCGQICVGTLVSCALLSAACCSLNARLSDVGCREVCTEPALPTQHPVQREGELLDRAGPDLEEETARVLELWQMREMHLCTLMVHLLALRGGCGDSCQ